MGFESLLVRSDSSDDADQTLSSLTQNDRRSSTRPFTKKENQEPIQQPLQVEAAIADTGLLSFILLGNFLGKSVDGDQLLHERGAGNAPFDVQDILRAAKRLEIKARAKHISLEKLRFLPTPCIASDTTGGFFILGQISERDGVMQCVVQSPLSPTPELLTLDQLSNRFGGTVVLMTTREALAGNARKFDIGWFIPALIKYRHALRDVLIASLFIQIVGLLSPLFFQVVIDKVLVHQSMSTLNVLCLGLAIVSLWEVGLGALRTWLFAHTTNRVDAELGSQLFRHLLSLPLAYFESRRVGDSVARVRELENIREFLTSNAVTLVIDLLFTVVFLAVMYFYSPLLTLAVVISMLAYASVSLAFTAPLRRLLDEKFNRGAENQSFLVEAVTGIGTLKAMAVEPQAQARWERQLAAYTSTGFKVTRLANWGSGLIQIISKITLVAILYFGAAQVIGGLMTVGALVAFNMLSGRVAAPVLRLAQMWQDFQRVRISVERLGDVLNAPSEPRPSATQSILPPIKGNIVFGRVRFRYRPDLSDVLCDINLSINQGEVIGIVGPSGSGKSTLTKLVQRLYTPTQGKVIIDDQDIALMPPDWLRRQIGVVLQENLLFNRSVRENIALADPTLPMQAVLAASEMAGAHEFITRLPQGYDTMIDERGANLSGGQRQRIAIARALITNPRILILDEATSALDAESEEIIQKNMKLMANGRTVIIIAHRLSAVRQADRIITIEKGSITEQGNHAQLLKAGGTYARLYQKQMGISQ
jgi:ATP-binding cassette, subfamily B, bacterial HlyB/CyaB